MNLSFVFPHRFWFLGLACALFVLALSPIAGEARREEIDRSVLARSARVKTLSAQIRQWETDAKEARILNDAMKGESVETYLAPMNRAALAAQFEPLAARAHLSDLAYTLGPEEKAHSDPLFPNLEDLSQSHLTLEADAALDAEAFSFLDDLSALPGRMDIERLSLKRKEGDIGLRNLRLRADLIWMANQATERSAK